MADEYARDYSDISAWGGAFKGFSDAWKEGQHEQDVDQDRNMKQMETKARIAADQAKMDREAAQTALENRRADQTAKNEQLQRRIQLQGMGKDLDENGTVIDTQLSPRERAAEQLKAFGAGAKIKSTDQYGNPTEYEMNPNTPTVIGAKAKQQTADAGTTRAEAAKVMASNKSTKEMENRWSKLADDLDPNKARGGNLAQLQKTINAADRIHTIFDQFPDGNIPKAQTTELATAVAGLISGGSPQSQQQIHEIVPASSSGSIEDLMSWYSNNPRGRQQQEFVKVLRESSEREQKTAMRQKMQAQRARLVKYPDLKSLDPDRWAKSLDAYGVTEQDEEPSQAAASPAGTAQPIAAAPPQGGLVKPNHGLIGGLLDKVGSVFSTPAQAQAAAHPQDNAALQWAKANPKDPRAITILKANGL